MDTVILDGVQYIKASVAAKQFKYTADYVGQLCRGKKVDARLVGRTWFVNPDSLDEHKNGKHKTKEKEVAKQVDREKESDSSERKTRVRRVSPVLNGKASRQLRTSVRDDGIPVKVTASYESDEESLLPTLKKTQQPSAPKSIAVEYVASKRVKVKAQAKESNFIAGDLPDVALSGKLSVSNIDESNISDVTSKNNDISDKREDIKKQSKPKKKVEKLKHVKSDKEAFVVPLHIDDSEPEFAESLNEQRSTLVQKTKKISPNASRRVSFTPSVVNELQKNRASAFVRLSPIIATVVAIVGVLTIFSATSIIQSDGSSVSSSVVLQLATLLDVMRQ